MLEVGTPIQERIAATPFQEELFAGTLPARCMKYFLEQDILFLELVIDLLRRAKGRTNDNFAYVDQFLYLLSLKMFEKGMVRQYNEFRSLPYQEAYSVNINGIRFVTDSPFQKYIKHLHDSFSEGTPQTFMAALLACPWSFKELKVPTDLEGHPYRLWFRGCETELTQNIGLQMFMLGKQIVDSRAAHYSDKEKERIKEAFCKSLEYEAAIWESCYAVKNKKSNTE